jgi:flagellar motor protein MotB
LGVRTVSVSRGETRAFAPDLSASGMQLNRRTEIRLVY